jgi:hypothetical protein
MCAVCIPSCAELCLGFVLEAMGAYTPLASVVATSDASDTIAENLWAGPLVGASLICSWVVQLGSCDSQVYPHWILSKAELPLSQLLVNLKPKPGSCSPESGFTHHSGKGFKPISLI